MKQRLVDGIEIAPELETIGKGLSKPDAHVHHRDLDDVFSEFWIPVFLDAHKSLVLAVLNDVLADLGEGHDETVDRPVIVMQVAARMAWARSRTFRL
jgi:hypothetical protein